MRIGRIFVRRLIMLVPLLIGVLFFTFMLVRLGGKDPSALLAGPLATAEVVSHLRSALQLDQPLWTQFGVYLQNVLQGDLGTSWVSNRPVAEELLSRLPATGELFILGFALGSVVGIPLGLTAAMRSGRFFDQISRIFSLVGISIPTYWLGLVLIFIFFFLLGWAPPALGRLGLMMVPPPTITGSIVIDALLVGEWEVARAAFSQLVLPVACTAIIVGASVTKQTRAIVLGVLGSDYVRYGQAQGLSPRHIHKMVLRNSLAPVITFIGTEMTFLVGTIALIEYVFAWGGVGQYGIAAIIAGDYAVVQAYVLLLAVFSMIVFLTVDIAVTMLDPRAA